VKHAFFLAVVVLSGCSGIEEYTTVARLRETTFPRSTEVEFFEEGQTPARAYDVIAKLETRLDDGEPWGTLYESMRERAKEIGADGVINPEQTIEIGTTSVNTTNWMVFTSTATQSTEKIKVLKGKAIRYK
jgi:hypothetical protein